MSAKALVRCVPDNKKYQRDLLEKGVNTKLTTKLFDTKNLYAKRKDHENNFINCFIQMNLASAQSY